MSSWLDIIIPIAHPEARLNGTIASLVNQTDHDFGVVLNENHFESVSIEVNEAERQLQAAGIPVRRMKAPFPLKRAEQWNWAHSQSQAEWLKLLLPGEQLKPAYVQRLKQRVNEHPKAQFVRCDAEVGTDWGMETISAPIDQDHVNPAEFLNYFPAQPGWISRSVNVAYTRTAWLATGGYSAHLPACAALNLNVILALHHGLDNIPETLASSDETSENSARTGGVSRVNRGLETWLILRQAKNYCLASRLPWSNHCLLAKGLSAGLGRW
jgi:hypothetical protein